MCGLFGNIKMESGKFNLPLFLTLGVTNDLRGGDSCGLFVDGDVYKGIADKATVASNIYCKFVNNLNRPNTNTKIAIGHCRKTSVGVTNMDTAQPVIIYNDNGKDIDMVLMHNGTLTNYNELKDKYLTKTPIWFTDSYIIAYCIYYRGFEILKEYKGAGAFVIVDYRDDKENPSTYFFKGSSIQKIGTQATEERPLYYSYNPVKKDLWFSSMHNILAAANYPVHVKEFECNKLYKFSKDHGFSAIATYDRSEIKSYKTYTSYYDDYDDYGITTYNNRYKSTNNTDTTTTITTTMTNMLEKSVISDNAITLLKKYNTKCIEIDLKDISYGTDFKYRDLKTNTVMHGCYKIMYGTTNSSYRYLWFYEGIGFVSRSLLEMFVDSFCEIPISCTYLEISEIINIYSFTKIKDEDQFFCLSVDTNPIDSKSTAKLSNYINTQSYTLTTGSCIKETYIITSIDESGKNISTSDFDIISLISIPYVTVPVLETYRKNTTAIREYAKKLYH